MHPQQPEIGNLPLAPFEIEAILAAGLRGVFVMDPDGRCRYASPRVCRIFDSDPSEMVGLPLNSVLQTAVIPSDGTGLSDLHDREIPLQRRNGDTFPARVMVEELRDPDNQLTGYVYFVHDLTEEKHVEDILRKTEKLASAGRMAAAIAHEINNPLEAVINLLYLLRQESLNPEAERFLSLAESEVERVSRIARQTLGFYRESGKLGRVDLRELLNMAVDVHCLRRADVRIHRRYRTAQTISGYASEIQQVFHNIVGNAIEAGAKHLFIHLRRWTETAPPRRSGLRITIADDGPGIDPSIRGQIFNPFITTKGERGTGLGLWTSRGIIVRHEGSIRLRTSTRPQRSGTCFDIFLPV